MGRVAMRKAREMRDAWLKRLTGGPRPEPVHPTYGTGRGADYADAPTAWVCARKKAYSSESLALHVANRLNRVNADTRTAREGFFGVVVNPYACGRCGMWHLGR